MRIVGEINTAVNRIFGRCPLGKQYILTNRDPETIHIFPSSVTLSGAPPRCISIIGHWREVEGPEIVSLAMPMQGVLPGSFPQRRSLKACAHAESTRARHPALFRLIADCPTANCSSQRHAIPSRTTQDNCGLANSLREGPPTRAVFACWGRQARDLLRCRTGH